MQALSAVGVAGMTATTVPLLMVLYVALGGHTEVPSGTNETASPGWRTADAFAVSVNVVARPATVELGDIAVM